MKKIFLTIIFFSLSFFSIAQTMTIDMLWKLGRLSIDNLGPDGKSVFYGITYYNIQANKGIRNLYSMNMKSGTAVKLTNTFVSKSNATLTPMGKLGYIQDGQWYEANADGSKPKQITNFPGGISLLKFSPDGSHVLFAMNVKTDSMMQDYYPDLDKSDGKIINNLMYRHWDSWSDGTHSHIFYATDSSGKIGTPVDIMKGESYDCPQQPDGGPEDVIWSPDGKKIVYVCKRKFGVAYAVSTNTDILVYDLSARTTMNFSVGMEGYDTQPQFSQDGSQFAWCSMAEDGYEADKNDIIVYDFSKKQKYNLTKDWDGTVNSFWWGRGDKAIFFIATYQGTDQIFKIKMPDDLSTFSYENIVQLTHGQFDINDIDGQSGMKLIVTRTDMNHASEIFSVDMQSGDMQQLSHVNDSMYNSIHMGKIQARWINTSDGQKELTWFIYPPDFDSAKVYPTLLYCQGGPESALSQFYSFRWNFQLMASYGYIIVAPCRRGMQGFGVKWNSEIAGDFGGQAIRDYLSAIDSATRLSYVDKTRLGCVGASYGGYSAFMLEGLHDGRFKTFIAHDGTFDNISMYGTTEEMWFPNKDLGGPYWQTPEPKAYTDFNPVTYAGKWNTPMLIIQGELDFRNTVNQGLEAFNVLQLKGIKSRLLYFPSEGHWVLKPQDAILWQRTFFEWLHETL